MQPNVLAKKIVFVRGEGLNWAHNGRRLCGQNRPWIFRLRWRDILP